MKGMHATISDLLTEISVYANFLPELVSNHDLPNLCLPSNKSRAYGLVGNMAFCFHILLVHKYSYTWKKAVLKILNSDFKGET
jgi:hypothetical protein